MDHKGLNPVDLGEVHIEGARTDQALRTPCKCQVLTLLSLAAPAVKHRNDQALCAPCRHQILTMPSMAPDKNTPGFHGWLSSVSTSLECPPSPERTMTQQQVRMFHSLHKSSQAKNFLLMDHCENTGGKRINKNVQGENKADVTK